MKYGKLPEDIVCYINIDESTFDSMSNEIQEVLVNCATRAKEEKERAEEEKKRAEEEKKRAEVAEKHVKELNEMRRVFGTPHILTPSLSDLPPTRSETVIMASKEYLEYSKILQDDFLAGLISKDEVTVKIHNFVDEKRREGDARRKRESKKKVTNIISAKIEDKIGKSEHVGFISNRFNVEDLDDCDTIVDEGFEVSVRLPQQSYVETKMIRMVEEYRIRCPDVMHPIFTAGVNAHFTASHRHPSYTCNVIMSEPNGAVVDGWYKRFSDNIYNKVRAFLDKEKYEEDIDEDMFNPTITINLNVYEIRTSKSWWPEGVPDMLELDDFVIFTANKDSVDCKQQCVEHFKLKYNPNIPFESNFGGMPVIIYQPLHHKMSQVRGFKDLMTTTIEEIPSTDCKNVVRLILDGEHCAVITKIKNKNRPRKKLVRRRFNAPYNSDVKEVYYDIETCRDDDTGRAVPYLVCWADDSDKVNNVHTSNVIERFVRELLDRYDGKEVVLMAWYGSGFDHQLIIGEMKSCGGSDDVIIKDNHIIYARIEFDNNTVFHLKDPYKFIPRKLASVAESFGVISKGNFPHDVVKSTDDLSDVYENWFLLRSEIVTKSYGDHDKTKLVSINYVREYMEENNNDTVLQKAIEYCTIDVLCCKQIWQKFRKIIFDEFHIHIRTTTMTLPQLSIELMQALIPKNVELHLPINRSDYECFMKSQYGGRVVAKTGIYQEQCVVLDVVSEYPTVMHDYDHPYGGYYKVNSIDWNKLGIYHVILDGYNMTNEQLNDYSEFLPYRDTHKKLHYDRNDHIEGWYCTYDLLTAKDDGYKITCIEGYEWEYKGRIFASFVDVAKTLKKKGTGAVKFVGKLLLNSVYGKMGQKPIDEDIYIVKKGITQQMTDAIPDYNDSFVIGGTIMNKPKFYGLDDKWDKMVIGKIGEVRYPTHNSVFILAAARRFLRSKMMEIKVNAPNVRVIYSDTDSLIIPMSSLGGYDISPHLGKEFGKLSDEIDGMTGIRPYEVIIAGRKMYGFYYNDDNGFPRQLMRLKGVPSNMQSIDDLKFILKNVDHSIKYRMLNMRRNLTNVKILDVTKTIKAVFK